MSKGFAMELGPLGIRVTVVASGYLDVRGGSDAYPDRAQEDVRAVLVRWPPGGRAVACRLHGPAGGEPGQPAS
jgi:NAD(P)-dependent dehydrogenase (short-subunit alcohol dehydrogenase family)